ncbi:MAG TPA: cysteine--tRNA ligase [Anaerolineae bacterium]
MLRLYNSLTRRVEPFQPQGNAVTIYVCGITPYDTTHLGHAFTYATADTLIRYLEFCGHTVRYVQNVTDIDDDILRKARQLGDDTSFGDSGPSSVQAWRDVGNRWTAHFIEDMKVLNVRPPDYFPGATDVIPEVIEAVRALIDAGVAYESGGNVYFRIDAWPDFGKLSRLARPQMLPIANERGNNPEDPHKKDPLDFVLWQAQAEAEPAWESPWGPGRPGWHIECSTMATRFLGETIDIHSGGADLLFPHHECEIAQVEPVTGREPFVRYWLHVAMVRHDGEKMSKSLGNLVMVRDLLKTWSPDALRIYMARHHYRRPWEHDASELDQAQEMAQLMQAAATELSSAETHPAEATSLRSVQALSHRWGNRRGGSASPLDFTPIEDTFAEAMDNDLDTAPALAALIGLAQKILDADSQRNGASAHTVAPARAALRRMARVFGLRLDNDSAEMRVIEGWNRHLRRFDDTRGWDQEIE